MTIGRAARVAVGGGLAVIVLLASAPAAADHDSGATQPIVTPAGARSATAAPRAGGWTTLRSSPMARTEVAGAALGRSIYVVGGYGAFALPSDQVERYDVDADSWSVVANLPVMLNHTAAVSYGGDLYVLGGYTGLPFSLGIGTAGIADASDAFLRYDPDADAWSAMPATPTKRAATAAAVIGDKLYVAAGADSFQALRTFEIFDFTTGAWSTGPDLPLATEHTAGAAAGGAFYVVGGRPSYGQPNNAFVQRYSPASGAWERVADLRRGHGGLGAVSVCGGIVAFGGEDPRSGLPGVIREVERYDPKLDTWSALPDMLTPRHGLAAGAVGNTVFALEGGPVTFAAVSNAAEALEVSCPGGSPGPAARGGGIEAKLLVKPHRAEVGTRTRFRFRVGSRSDSCRRGALIRFAGRHKRTNRKGRATIFKRLGRRGIFKAALHRPGCIAKPGRVRARPAHG